MRASTFNRLVDEQAFDTRRTICGRTPERSARRLFRYRGRLVQAHWNYAYGKWSVEDRKSGYGSAPSPAAAAAECSSPLATTVRDAIEEAIRDGFRFPPQ